MRQNAKFHNKNFNMVSQHEFFRSILSKLEYYSYYCYYFIWNGSNLQKLSSEIVYTKKYIPHFPSTKRWKIIWNRFIFTNLSAAPLKEKSTSPLSSRTYNPALKTDTSLTESGIFQYLS